MPTALAPPSRRRGSPLARLVDAGELALDGALGIIFRSPCAVIVEHVARPDAEAKQMRRRLSAPSPGPPVISPRNQRRRHAHAEHRLVAVGLGVDLVVVVEVWVRRERRRTRTKSVRVSGPRGELLEPVADVKRSKGKSAIG